MSSESMLDAEAELMLEREEWTKDRTSCSVTVPTDPVLWWWWWEVGRRTVEEEYGAEIVEPKDVELCLAASSMLWEAFSSWAVMSSREKLDSSGGLLLELPTLTVDAGEARVLLLVLPPLLLAPPLLLPVCLVLWLRPAGGFWRTLVSPARPRREGALLGLPTVLSSCSMEQRSAIRASRSTASPWFRASVRKQMCTHKQI